MWQFSTDGSNWMTFTEADALSTLASGVPTSGIIDVYLRLTMPTEITSSEEHSATVTIVATSP